MDIMALAKFLNEANKATYANKDAPRVTPARPRSRDYEFKKGNLTYHDTYFGPRDFIGEEVIYEGEVPIWGANYFGYILEDSADTKEVYDFLRQALMQEYADVIPVRGPTRFADASRVYEFKVNGDLNNFEGEEKISFDGKMVYRCLVHGGLIR